MMVKMKSKTSTQKSSSITYGAFSAPSASVRRWAREQGISVNPLGKLPAALFARYETAHMEQEPFEILAHYLEPRFGNIYSHDSPPPWNKALYRAVRSFLVRDLPPDVWRRLIGSEVPSLSEDPKPDKRHVNGLISSNDLWDLALVIRIAAVEAVPTLDQLFGQLHLADVWPSEEEKEDVAVWLDAHVKEDGLRVMEQWLIRQGRSNQGFERSWHGEGEGYSFTELPPSEILAAWSAISG